ncbi:VOC family protein [Halioxenophilus sp. WMMB6]|uniref:VOC family protein n=1 Tax=Halioxenophilus sp. WMMB6 TaxID=3073815 RepID=UPI00295E268B|nr:VOC family protein [Halioxenophilus sp. WMMB6]
MHKSKLAGFIIDCETDDLNTAASFWGQALGMAIEPFPGAEGEKYVRLCDPNDALHIEVQKVNHPSRVHLDIETDDIEAEVKRLQALGATEVARVDSWCVMQAPTGQKFCVVKQEGGRFAVEANCWPTQK